MIRELKGALVIVFKVWWTNCIYFEIGSQFPKIIIWACFGVFSGGPGINW